MVISFREKIEKELLKEPSRIHFRRVNCTAHPITAQATSYVSDNIITTRQLPCKLLIFFVPAAAYNGNYKRNPLELVRKMPIMEKRPDITRIIQRITYPAPELAPPPRRPARPAPPTPSGSGWIPNLPGRKRKAPTPSPAPESFEPSAPPEIEPIIVEEVQIIPGVMGQTGNTCLKK